MTDLKKLQAFDAEMRKRFGAKWLPAAEWPEEDRTESGPAAGTGTGAVTGTGTGSPGGAGKPGKSGPRRAGGKENGKAGTLANESTTKVRTKPNRAENELMLNLMILRNSLVNYAPAARDRARRAGKWIWRDLRLMTTLVCRVQEALLETMPESRDAYYRTYAQHGHYELVMNGPVRGQRHVLIGDKHLAAICEAAMESDCVMCVLDGAEIDRCPLRQGLLEVAPPREVQDGKWKKCEYRDVAASLVLGEDVIV